MRKTGENSGRERRIRGHASCLHGEESNGRSSEEERGGEEDVGLVW